MRSLTLVIVSFLLLGNINESFSQTKKYLRRNRDAQITIYGDSNMYSRGVYVDSSIAYFASSDGSVIQFNAETEKSTRVLKLARRGENRDIEVSNNLMIVMQSGDNGSLTKIDSQGNVGFYEPREWKGLFLDAFDFHEKVGLLLGDPVDGYFTLYHTIDGGRTWQKCDGKVPAKKGEAAFAASGSNVHVFNDSTYAFISGGMQSSFHKSSDNGKTWVSVDLPYYPSETNGPYSMCFSDDKNGVIVGGNYKQSDLKMNTTYFTHDGGETWYNSFQPPGGYRSCVIHHNGVYYACGQNGIDFSYNGEVWVPFAEGKYYAMAVFQNQVIATMRHGRFKSFELVD
ncbi:MAG: WD40/YVTN/BNR-like repeat-containing protein [Fluviicola sp.]